MRSSKPSAVPKKKEKQPDNTTITTSTTTTTPDNSTNTAQPQQGGFIDILGIPIHQPANQPSLNNPLGNFGQFTPQQPPQQTLQKPTMQNLLAPNSADGKGLQVR
jgi:hypothetical protein